MISNQSLTCPKGTSLTFEIDMDTGSDLTGATAQWALAESWFDQAKVYLTKTGVGDGLFIGQDAGIWKITVNLAPSDTIDVPSGLLYHDCKVLLQNGDVEDVANGPFYLDPSVNVLNTNAPSTRNLRGIQTVGSIGQSATGTLGSVPTRNLAASQALGAIGQTAAATGTVWNDSSTVPVIIFTGESNAGGMVSNSGISSAARPDVKILNNTSLVFESLQIGVNNLIGHTGLTANATHGWELELAIKVAANTWGTSPVYLIKTGQGGSLVADWAVGSTYMNTFQTRWNAAASAIAALGKIPAPVIWMSLGVNDSNTYGGAFIDGAFQQPYNSLLDRLRTAIGFFVPIMLTKFPPAHATYSAAIDHIVANSLWTYAIDSTTANEFLIDPNHWDEGGMTILADAMKDITVDPTKVGLGTAYQTNYTIYTGPPFTSTTTWDNNYKGITPRLYYGWQDAKGNGAFSSVRGTTGKTSGKFYFEVKVFEPMANDFFVGLMDNTSTSAAQREAFNPDNSGMVRADGLAAAAGFTAVGSGGLGTLAPLDIIGCAVDATAKKMWLSKNNTWLSSGDPAAGTNPYFTWSHTNPVYPSVVVNSNQGRLRLVPSATTYTPASGFSVWG